MKVRYWLGYALMSFMLSGCLLDGQVQFQTSASVIPESDLAVVGYERTVYKFIQNATCINCHVPNKTTSQSPYFAVSDPVAGRQAIIDNGKVNFTLPESSRLYQRLHDDKHNCFGDASLTLDQKCAQNASDMLAAIYAWKEYEKSYTVDMGVVTASQPFLPGGVPPLPTGATLFEAESAYSSQVLMPDTYQNDVNGNRRLFHSGSLGKRWATSVDQAASKAAFLYVPTEGRPADALDLHMGNYVSYSFHATNPSYEVYIKLAAPSAGIRFDTQINSAAYVTKTITASTDGSWQWQHIGTYATSNGSTNTFKIGILDEGPKLDQVLVIPSNYANAAGLASDDLDHLTGRKVELTFDLNTILDPQLAEYNLLNPNNMISGDNLKLVLDITVFDDQGYEVEKGTVVDKDSNHPRANNLMIKGVRFMLNNAFNPQDSDWVTVNKVMPTAGLNSNYATDSDPTTVSDPNYNLISVKPMLVQKQKGAALDQVAIAFEVFDYTQLSPTGIPIPSTLDVTSTVSNMISTYCINCHSSFAADADRTQWVVKNPTTFRLDMDSTVDWLFAKAGVGSGEGFILPGETTPRPTAHVRRSHERMMRPPVRLPNNDMAWGGGAEGSAIYRVWRFHDRVPAEMEPYVDAISTGSATSNALFDKFKTFINGQSTDPSADLYREIVEDTVKPRLEGMMGVDAGVSTGQPSFSISWDAFDDVSAIKDVALTIQKNSPTDPNQETEIVAGNPSGAPCTTTSANSPCGLVTAGMGPNPRRFDGTYMFKTSDHAGSDMRNDNFRFIAQAEDESGNVSETMNIGDTVLTSTLDKMLSTVGNCDVRLSQSGSDTVQGADSNNAIPANSLTIGQPITIVAHAQNNFGNAAYNVAASITSQNGTVANGAMTVAGSTKINFNNPTFTPNDSQNNTITITVVNQDPNATPSTNPDRKGPVTVDPYTCTKAVSYSTNISQLTPTAVGASLRIGLKLTSAFKGDVTVNSVVETRVNDSQTYPVPVNSIAKTQDTFGNLNRTLTYDWPNTARDGNPHTFTFSLTFGNRTTATQVVVQ